MDIVVTVLVLALALAALGYPLYRARTEAALVSGSALDDLLAQRDGVYATLRDIEMDRETGKLDAADYGALREKYMLRATQILQQVDVLRGQGEGQAASDEIEQEVAALRHKPKPAPGADRARTKPVSAGAGQNKNSAAVDRFCANCGRQSKPGDKFCAKCGNALG